MEREYTVSRIDGDYAHLCDKETNDDFLVAMALLPDDIDEGKRVLYKDFTYTVID